MIRSDMSLLSAFLTVFFLVTVAAQNDGLFTSDNKVDCVNKLVDWCDNMKYPTEGTALSMISIAHSDSTGRFHRIFCASDTDSTNCTRNGSPWFSCNAEHDMIYNGVSLQKNKVDGVDDEVCNTTKTAFNDVFIQNLSYNPANITSANTTSLFNNEFEDFFKQLAELTEQLDYIRNNIFGNFFPFSRRNFNLFPYPSEGRESATAWPTLSPSGQGNQLERE